MKHFRTTILLPLLAGILGMCIAVPASAAESALDFRVAPVADSQLSDGGDYFVLKMEPGEVVTQAVEVTNPSAATLAVRLAGVDAATAQMGGVDYADEALPTDATGSWIAVKDDSVELAPGRSTTVEFAVQVPMDAVPGVHLAGLVVWVDRVDEKTVAGSQATMNVQSRRVIAVQVDLPGPALPVLEIRGAQAEARPDGLYLGIALFNAGAGFVKGTGTVSIEGREDLGTFALDTVVPGTGTNYPFRWAGAGVPDGSYEVTVEIDYGVAITSWEGNVVVGPGLQQDLRGRGVESSSAPSATKYLLIAGASLLLVLGAFLLRRRRFSGRGFPRLPRISIQRVQATRPLVASGSAAQGKPVPPFRPVSPTPVAYVPRSEELQRRVPPPPPPPLARPGRPGLESEIGVGTRFSIHLPSYVDLPVPVTEKDRSASTNGKKPTLLVKE